MARPKGPMVDITWNDLNKIDAIIEYCGGIGAAAKWIEVTPSSITKWRKAKTIEGVQFAEEARERINKLHKELDMPELSGIAADAKVPVFKGEHKLMEAYKLTRQKMKEFDGDIGATFEEISNVLAHKILDDRS